MTSTGEADPREWALVVPVKRLVTAKSRLAKVAGELRPDLALAFASDTVRAALDCPLVAGVVVVTDEPAAAAELTALGAAVVPDLPDAGLNPALDYGASQAARHYSGAGVGALSADLPALRPRALADVLEACRGWPRAFVRDCGGSGTTLLTSRTPRSLHPAFGPGSAARHRGQGASEVTCAGEEVRRDVDTPADLLAALDLGVGPRTARVSAALPGLDAVRAAG